MRSTSDTTHGDRGEIKPVDVSTRKQPRENMSRIDVGPDRVITDIEKRYLN